MIKKVFLPLSVAFFVGCGGGGSSSSVDDSNTNTVNSITSTLIDSAISGVSFTCGEDSGLTDTNGRFTCKENTEVYFSIGGVTLGNTTVSADDLYITPARLFNLENNNISDARITNFLQFIQSLDSDNNASNGIDINQTIRDSSNKNPYFFIK